jgi:hypothetical protein
VNGRERSRPRSTCEKVGNEWRPARAGSVGVKEAECRVEGECECDVEVVAEGDDDDAQTRRCWGCGRCGLNLVWPAEARRTGLQAIQQPVPGPIAADVTPDTQRTAASPVERPAWGDMQRRASRGFQIQWPDARLGALLWSCSRPRVVCSVRRGLGCVYLVVWERDRHDSMSDGSAPSEKTPSPRALCLGARGAGTFGRCSAVQRSPRLEGRLSSGAGGLDFSGRAGCSAWTPLGAGSGPRELPKLDESDAGSLSAAQPSACGGLSFNSHSDKHHDMTTAIRVAPRSEH